MKSLKVGPCRNQAFPIIWMAHGKVHLTDFLLFLCNVYIIFMPNSMHFFKLTMDDSENDFKDPSESNNILHKI